MVKTISELPDFNPNNNINNMMICVGNGHLSVAKLKQKTEQVKSGSIEMRLSSNKIDEDELYYYILLDGTDYTGTKYSKVYDYLPAPLPNLISDVYALGYNPNAKDLVLTPKIANHKHIFDSISNSSSPLRTILNSEYFSTPKDNQPVNVWTKEETSQPINVDATVDILKTEEQVDYIIGDNVVKNPYIVINKSLVDNTLRNITPYNLNELPETTTLLSEDNYIIDDGENTDTKQLGKLLNILDYKIGSIIKFPIGEQIDSEIDIISDLLIYKYKRLDAITEQDIIDNPKLIDLLGKLGYEDDNFPKFDVNTTTYFAYCNNMTNANYNASIDSHLFKVKISWNPIPVLSGTNGGRYIWELDNTSENSSTTRLLSFDYIINFEVKSVISRFTVSNTNNHETGYLNVVPYICIGIEWK